MEFLILLVLVGAVTLFFIKRSPHSSGAAAPGAAASDDPRWKYRHVCKDTEIALDSEQQIIRLRGVFNRVAVQKEYKYADVRTWEFKVMSGGAIRPIGNIGTNAMIGVAVANYMQGKQNEAETGLFIGVRDIEFPEWHILFPADKGRDLELKRWMEILRQEVNRD
ncbi:MAG TPA: DUF4755 domain-containing protein [Allosphingosinicella sp.]|nr:DUF4755 domain-containing protein [Allosphingosinicella sp.]